MQLTLGDAEFLHLLVDDAPDMHARLGHVPVGEPLRRLRQRGLFPLLEKRGPSLLVVGQLALIRKHGLEDKEAADALDVVSDLVVEAIDCVEVLLTGLLGLGQLVLKQLVLA